MDKRGPPRKNSFEMPIVNPFTHDLKLSILHKVQVAIMSISIAPLRLVLFLIFLMLAWIVTVFATIGMTKYDKKPASFWRRCLFRFIASLGRLLFFLIGFLWVDIKGNRAPIDKTRLLVVAPHSSFFDALLFFCISPMPSPISRSENAEGLLFGTLLKPVQPVLVSRHDPKSRQKTIQEIHLRATSTDDWPHIVIFPEGTCTNRKALITFKAGAFIPGVPVQPVLLRYPGHLDTYTWTMDSPSAINLLWLTLCQFHNRFQIEFLPVYYPSEEEVASPRLYAENVRHVMSEALGIPCTDHTFEDCRLMYYAKSRDLPMEAGLVEFSKLSRKLGISINEMREMLDEFANISRSCKDGVMRIEEFSEHLNLPITDALHELFHLYDRTGTGFLDFREYVIGMSLVSQAAVTEKTVKLAFSVFDRDGDGYVSRDELDHVLKSVFGSEFQSGNIWDKIDDENEGKVNYDRFYSFVKKRPEYAKLFMYNAELEQDDIPNDQSSTRLRHSDEGSSKRATSETPSTSHNQKDPTREKTE